MENKFKFYNTLTRNIDTVIPHEDGKIAMYTCGPTVYHYAHIGNLRSYIMEDVLEKACNQLQTFLHYQRFFYDNPVKRCEARAQDGDGDCEVLHGRVFR